MRVLEYRGSVAIVDATRDDVKEGDLLESKGQIFLVHRVASYACAVPVSPVGLTFQGDAPEVGADLKRLV